MNPEVEAAHHHLPSSSSRRTLLVRHLPEAIPLDTLSRLFSHYGASSVRPQPNGRVRNCAFVDFQNEAAAFQAQRQLNGLRFLGKVLSVEIANKGVDNKATQQGEAQPGSLQQGAECAKDRQQMGSCPAHEPISQRLGLDYPFPPYLEYAYPPPDGNILTNIVNALIAVPRFYTQCLHLMNKMNIPAPFRMALPTPPLPTQEPVSAPRAPLAPYPGDLKTKEDHVSTSESEMESSDEDATGRTTHRAKRMKPDAIVGPAVDKGVAHESVGLRPATLVPKEIPVIKKKNSVLQIKIAPKKIHNEQMSDIATTDLPVSDDACPIQTIATPEELKSGRMPPEEILSLPMFKNYTAGNPTPVLYVKNLAKDVVAEDFYYLFGSLFGSIDTAKSCVNVKLMKEGRMKGQAFITFPSVELAQSALNLVNGYVFKGKPIVIQFGRNTATAKAN